MVRLARDRVQIPRRGACDLIRMSHEPNGISFPARGLLRLSLSLLVHIITAATAATFMAGKAH